MRQHRKECIGGYDIRTAVFTSSNMDTDNKSDETSSSFSNDSEQNKRKRNISEADAMYIKTSAKKGKNKQAEFEGEIVKIIPQRGIGFIKPIANVNNNLAKDVFFHINNVFNVTDEDMFIQCGSRVKYDLNHNPKDGDKPEAKRVIVDQSSKSDNPNPNKRKERKELSM